jgi:hypothetical protein
MKQDKTHPARAMTDAKDPPEPQTAALPAMKPGAPDGLYLVGQVNGRQRRAFDKKGGGQRYVITLSVLTASGLFKPERWCDSPSPTDTPRVGDHVCLPVCLQYFNTRAGTGVRLVWGDSSPGEDF